MPNEIDLDAMLAEMDRAAERTRATLDGRYGQIYTELRGLSKEEIEAVTPDTTDQEEYERLMALVQEATRQNLDQAELVNRIKALSNVAVTIAKKVPSLAAILL